MVCDPRRSPNAQAGTVLCAAAGQHPVVTVGTPRFDNGSATAWESGGLRFAGTVWILSDSATRRSTACNEAVLESTSGAFTGPPLDAFAMSTRNVMNPRVMTI